MTLLDETYTFTPADSRTNFGVEFTLAQDYFALLFECGYSPKTVRDKQLSAQAVMASIGLYVPRWQLPLYPPALAQEVSLVNLLTLSLDYESAYLGCAHRHAASQRHTVSAAGSSPGFVRHAASAGSWRAVINIHAVISPQVSYHLKITALEEGAGDD